MQLRIIMLAILVFHVDQCRAQVIDSVASRYAKTIKASDLKKHVYTLASDEFEGRVKKRQRHIFQRITSHWV
jgi:hypothetical protein